VPLANKKIYKVAGLSLLGFCAVSFGMDKANVGPLASQIASFSGAFIGALVAARKQRHPGSKETKEAAALTNHQVPAKAPDAPVPNTVEQINQASEPVHE
jgi:hypothetical protein